MTIEYGNPVIRTYYIIFDKKRHKIWRWWQHFTKQEFFHCFILTEIEDGLSLKVEMLAGGMDFQLINMPIDQCVTAYANGGSTSILSCTVNSTNLYGYTVRGFISCVSLTKAFLWLRKSYLTITPFQLYKRLIKRGAVCIKPYAPYINN